MNVPHDCPCGRPRAGGTLLEVEIGWPTPTYVEFQHPDGVCVWRRDGESLSWGRWIGAFGAAEANA